jgi:hypothetical protein
VGDPAGKAGVEVTVYARQILVRSLKPSVVVRTHLVASGAESRLVGDQHDAIQEEQHGNCDAYCDEHSVPDARCLGVHACFPDG